ncbi:carboxypeptidase regulatory-like domain-containing protein [Halomontanus rarus]|uniref:carboxypeptidase regulatory-like domain-containing protein n=1 Tax=Halomontanus rarus TaxID=3034020 RepID=UPI0023E80FE6|nr:carboxypeptidase regulatory-like domain-containing protein [Halovivax sp. TS33]
MYEEVMEVRPTSGTVVLAILIASILGTAAFAVPIAATDERASASPATDTETAVDPPLEGPESELEVVVSVPDSSSPVVDADGAMELASNATTVSGTVTDADGDPLEGVTVASDLGDTSVTDDDGAYSLVVPAGERTIGVSGFGVESTETTVDVSGGELEHDVVIETVPDAELVSDAPSQVRPGESYDLEVRVSAVDRLGITRNGTLSNATIAGGDGFGTETNVSDLERGDLVTATVVTDPAEVGTLSIAFEFESDESITVTTGTSSVVSDSLTVGTDGDVESVQEALELARPGATVRLTDDEYELDATDGPVVLDAPVTLTAADGVDPVLSVTGDAASTFDAPLFVTADDATVSGITIDANGTTDGISIVGGPEDVRVVNTTVGGGVYGVWVGRGSSVELVGNDITGVSTAVDVWGTADTVLENRLESEIVDLSVASEADVRTVSDNEFVGTGTGISVDFDGSAAVVSGNRFAGETGVDAFGNVTYSAYNDFAAVDTTAISAAGDGFVSTLDYFGERGPEPDELVGPVESEPFATAPPTELPDDPAEVQQFGYHLELPADEPTAVSFPGPMANDLESTFGEFDGTIYEFDGEHDEWVPVDDGRVTPNALDAYVVVPEENVTALVEFETSDESEPGIPGEADVDAGWNLIGSPTADGVEDAYAATSAAPSRILHSIGAPGGQPVETERGDDWLSYTFGSETNEPTVSPHAGYFVYANRDGTVGANAYPGITLGEVDELLGFDGAPLDVSDETSAAQRSETQHSSTAVNASS